MSLGVRHHEPETGRSARDVAVVPPAVRATSPGWRDPRLWVGLLIVAVSVVAGSRLLAAADDTVAVWSVASDAGPGAQLTTDDLVARRVRFADADELAAYYRADEPLPGDLRLVRAVGAGELLPRAAVGDAGQQADTVELSLAVDAEQVPPSVHAGSVVDVYLLAKAGAGAPILHQATVVDAPDAASGFGSTGGRRQLVVAVPEADAAAFVAAVGQLDTPVLTVVRRG